MTANITPKFQLELAKLEQTALLDLFDVDMRQLTGKDGNRGELFRFYAGTNELTQPIIWQGNRYTPFGVKAEGFEMSGQGASNRPTLTQDMATFTLALPTETDNALINKRTILVTCPWVYRSIECGYTGNPVADEKDQPTTDPKKDKCSGCLRGCQLRHNTLNYGGFIGVNKLG